MSQLLQAYIVGWAFLLGMLVMGGSGGGQGAGWIAFMAISERAQYFTQSAITVWLFYTAPCVVIFVIGFFVARASRGG